MSAEVHTGTGSRTIADLFDVACQKYGDRVMARAKRDGEWVPTTFAEAGEIVSEIGRGLIALGLEPGDRVCILCHTRVEWTYVDHAITAAGLVVVPIYPTNSPKECAWVVGNSEARAIVCEDASQLAKITEVRGELPALEHLITIEPADGAVALADVRDRGRGEATEPLAERTAAVSPEDPYTLIYTSGTTGPPKGVVLTHGNYKAMVESSVQVDHRKPEGEVTYLYLPLAHAFALLMQLLSIETGGEIAYFGGDTKQIVPELSEVKPTFLPSVPRIFEKIYTLVTAQAEPEQLAQAVELGGKVRDLEQAGQPIPEALQGPFAEAEEKLFKNVRAAFGGRLDHALTGAAPIASEILAFFWACGAPVFEGYGMTETSTGAAISNFEHHRWGSVGQPLPGVEVRIAEDGEILLRGANIFTRYWDNEEATAETLVDGWLHTGDLGHLDEDNYLFITGRKKDIIITAGGKNLTPANLENDMRQSRWISQALMHGDRRPYPVMLITLDEEEIVPWAKQEGIEDTSIAGLAENPRVIEMIQADLDNANAHYAQVEQVKRFFILEHDLSQETGELTPTLKVKRNVVNDRYSDRFEELYARPA